MQYPNEIRLDQGIGFANINRHHQSSSSAEAELMLKIDKLFFLYYIFSNYSIG